MFSSCGVLPAQKPGDRRDVSYKITQSAEGATQPSPDREVGVQVVILCIAKFTLDIDR